MDLVPPAGGSLSLEDHQGGTPIQLSSPQSSRQPSYRPSCAPSRAPSRTPTRCLPTPSITRKTARSSSTPSAASNRTSTTSLTDEEARQTLETWIESSEWYQKDEVEPVVGAPGVPTCARQLAERGQSIYCCFLLVAKGRGGKVLGWKSAADPRSGWDRLHRAISKERVRRGHRPYKCSGRHEPNWFVHPPYHQSSLINPLAPSRGTVKRVSVITSLPEIFRCHVTSGSCAPTSNTRLSSFLRQLQAYFHKEHATSST